MPLGARREVLRVPDELPGRVRFGLDGADEVALCHRRGLVAATRLIAPRLSSRARDGERLRTLPADLVAEARAAGLFGLATPRSLGGSELAPIALVEVVEEHCRADGSAGWTILIGNSTAFLAWLDPAVARDILHETSDPVGASSFAPA
ncbi:acyl-CoA dehydrogenase family protein [Pseudonocardia sp. GCM10023141]|uniref:acyl-CoA dehydrogenase family protein n=1 Tax=Pseudonocardia sp. GCM10023141 TaxID=3252653 RepID=UPI0036121F46